MAQIAIRIDEANNVGLDARLQAVGPRAQLKSFKEQSP